MKIKSLKLIRNIAEKDIKANVSLEKRMGIKNIKLVGIKYPKARKQKYAI